MSHKKNKMVDSGSEIIAAYEELKKSSFTSHYLTIQLFMVCEKLKKKVRSHFIT